MTFLIACFLIYQFNLGWELYIVAGAVWIAQVLLVGAVFSGTRDDIHALHGRVDALYTKLSERS